MLKLKFRRLALLDTSAWAFTRGISACAISTNISCDVPVKYRMKFPNNLAEIVPRLTLFQTETGHFRLKFWP